MSSYEDIIRNSKKKEQPLKNNYYNAKLDYYTSIHRRYYLEMQQSLASKNKKHRYEPKPLTSDHASSFFTPLFDSIKDDDNANNKKDSIDNEEKNESPEIQLSSEAASELKQLYMNLCKQFHPDREKLVASTNKNKMQTINCLYKEKNLEGLKQIYDEMQNKSTTSASATTKTEEFVDIEAVKKKIKIIKASECYIWSTQPEKREIIESFYLTDEEFYAKQNK